VRCKRNGNWLDKNGKPSADLAETHIPFDQFIFKPEIRALEILASEARQRYTWFPNTEGDMSSLLKLSIMYLMMRPLQMRLKIIRLSMIEK